MSKDKTNKHYKKQCSTT